jgi:hypothetical protein
MGDEGSGARGRGGQRKKETGLMRGPGCLLLRPGPGSAALRAALRPQGRQETLAQKLSVSRPLPSSNAAPIYSI